LFLLGIEDSPQLAAESFNATQPAGGTLVWVFIRTKENAKSEEI
jgi:hypothetical protein